MREERERIMADNWYAGISSYTDMMREVRQAALNILEQNAACRLLDARQEDALRAQCRENDMLIQKMETRSFEVAVVGLENSGKSSVANALIEEGKASVRVLPCSETWHGITYQEDLPDVIAAIAALRAQGLYPANLLD